MTVNYGNFAYFGFILFFVAGFAMLYALLRGKSKKIQYWVLFGLVCFNFVLHFLAPLYLGIGFGLEYVRGQGYQNAGVNRLFLNNISSVVAVLSPLLFLCRGRFVRTAFIFLSLMAGVAAMFGPMEIVGKQMPYHITHIDVFRFYLQHALMWIVPALLLSLGHFQLQWREIWLAPTVLLVALGLVMISDVMRYIMGSLPYPAAINESMQWGLPRDGRLEILRNLIPAPMTRVPFGPNRGAEGFWPLLYLVPGVFLLLPVVGFFVIGVNKGCVWLAKRLRV